MNLKRILAVASIVFTVTANAASIESLIKTYGKTEVIDVINPKLHKKLTVYVDEKFIEVAAPDPNFITAETLSIDIARAGLTFNEVESIIKAKLAANKAYADKKKQDEDSLKIENEKIRHQINEIRQEELKFFASASQEERRQFQIAKQNGEAIKKRNEINTQASQLNPVDEIRSAQSVFTVEAQLACQNRVERIAQFQFEWTDNSGLARFQSIRWENNGNRNHLIAVGDKIKMQNQYGAWMNVKYVCKIDIETDSVIELGASPGRI